MRKTANDYLKEYTDLQNKIEALKARIIDRLICLAKAHPDAIIDKLDDTEIKANAILTLSVNGLTLNKDISVVLVYIKRIEDWLADQSNVKQGKLF
jgi:hypothetical protein